MQKIVQADKCIQGFENSPSTWHRVLASTKLSFCHLKGDADV